MASFSQTCNVVSVRLDESNYPTWLFQMEHHLRGHGLLKLVDGSLPCPPPFLVAEDGTRTVNTCAREKWLEQDSLLISLITNTLSPEALTLVIGCCSSMEVWLTLKQRYATVSEAHVMQLKSTLQNIQKGSDSIEKYLLRFKSVRNQLAVLGVRMSDQDVKVLILAGLPSEYGHTRQIIRGKAHVDLEEVRSLLLSAESEFELEHKALPLSPFTAMHAQNGLTGMTGPGIHSGSSIFNTSIPWSANCASSASCALSTGPAGLIINYSNAATVPTMSHMNYTTPQASANFVNPSGGGTTMSFVHPSASSSSNTPVFPYITSGYTSGYIPSSFVSNTSGLSKLSTGTTLSQSPYMMNGSPSTIGYVTPPCNSTATSGLIVQTNNDAQFRYLCSNLVYVVTTFVSCMNLHVSSVSRSP
ncbi:putative RNA-directed DNA polymerase [Rosa chinensis]|uniref:Putative RNA-directed DNA polymerase n=1 Tax=Rosa chinensis TaxID=74649 RepID=A0A2P6PGG4_ROSCH|nr:putative RNA-directed DNA polymerase [Rosa chinensis]